ncbi:N-6 DNA methylase [Streptomyces sp. NPDC056601]|uniref:N-6 DNA methylase n=1 Tax=Streptomyces sp. NPDC056601 TaxID=3345875 RepID=UPI0036863584
MISNAKHAEGGTPDEVARGSLGAWLAGRGDGRKHTGFQPDRVALVLGTARGRVIGAYDVIQGPTGRTWDPVEDDAGRERVRFHGETSKEFAHLVGRPSPRRWKRGERNPVKVMDLSELRGVYANVTPEAGDAGTALRAAIGGATVLVDEQGDLTVEAPPGVAVTVRPAPHTDPRPSSEYYTPTALTDLLVRTQGGGFDSETSDPAMGSGAFLLAAIEVLAQRVGADSETLRLLADKGQDPIGSEQIQQAVAAFARVLTADR